MNRLSRSTVTRVLFGMAAVIAIAVGLALYLHIASVQSRVNHNLYTGNQNGYTAFAIESWESSFTFTGYRNRMPLYPWIQGLTYSPKLTETQFFVQGKSLNVAISLVCLAVIAALFFARFSNLYATYSIVIIGFLLFNVKSPFFQSEILYYTLFALAFMLSIESIRRPKWYKSAGVGVLFALAHFTKASAILGLFIYTCSFVVTFPSILRIRNGVPQQIGLTIMHAIAPIVVFTILLFPYFVESKSRYGHYLYNVNTTFYFWYDSWDEAIEGTLAAGDRDGWPDLPDDEIPSMSKYLSEHTLADILRRLGKSLHSYVDTTCTRTGSWQLLGNCIHLGIGSAFALVCVLAGIRHQRTWRNRRSLQTSLFIAGFLALYHIAALWYWPIIGGARAILALVIPIFWTIGLIAERSSLQLLSVQIAQRKVRLTQLMYVILLIVALYQVYELAAFRAGNLYGGR